MGLQHTNQKMKWLLNLIMLRKCKHNASHITFSAYRLLTSEETDERNRDTESSYDWSQSDLFKNLKTHFETLTKDWIFVNDLIENLCQGKPVSTNCHKHCDIRIVHLQSEVSPLEDGPNVTVEANNLFAKIKNLNKWLSLKSTLLHLFHTWKLRCQVEKKILNSSGVSDERVIKLRRKYCIATLKCQATLLQLQPSCTSTRQVFNIGGENLHQKLRDVNNIITPIERKSKI